MPTTTTSPRGQRVGRGRSRAAALSPLALLVALVLGLSGCAAVGSPYDVPVVGACRGFTSQGFALQDHWLLARALATWRHQGGAMAQPVPVAPPVGPVCVLEARRLPGRAAVTLADATHLATYDEGPAGVTQVVTSVLPSGGTHALPVVPVDGAWLLARAVTSTQVLVGGRFVPTQVTDVPAGARALDVDAAVNRFAAAHPSVLPHLLVLVRAGGTLYAATAGAPYGPDRSQALVVSLGADDALTRQRWQDLLDQPSGPVLLAQSVGFAPQGLQVPQQVDRQLTLVGLATTSTDPVLVVRQETVGGGPPEPAVVTVAQLSDRGADVQPVGAVTSPTGGWVGSVWLSDTGRGSQTGELLVMGEAGTLGRPGRDLVLEASAGGTGVFAPGPLQVVPASDLGGGLLGPRPEVTVHGRVGPDEVLPLTPLGLS